MARHFTRDDLAPRSGSATRRRVRAAVSTRPAFHYAVLCVWPVSL